MNDATGGDDSASVRVERDFTKVSSWLESVGTTSERREPRERGIGGGMRKGEKSVVPVNFVEEKGRDCGW